MTNDTALPENQDAALKAEARSRPPMMPTSEPLDTSRTRIKLRVCERLLADARSLGIDVDVAVEARLEAAIRAAKIDRFQSLAADLSAKAASRGLTDEKLEEIRADIS